MVNHIPIDPEGVSLLVVQGLSIHGEPKLTFSDNRFGVKGMHMRFVGKAGIPVSNEDLIKPFLQFAKLKRFECFDGHT